MRRAAKAAMIGDSAHVEHITTRRVHNRARRCLSRAPASVAIDREDLPHEVADLFVAALVKDQNRRPGAAQRAAEQTGRAQL